MYTHAMHAYGYKGYIHSIHACDFKTVLNIQQQQYHLMGSRFHEVWRDFTVGSLNLTSITTHKEADSERPTKIFEKTIL